MSASKGWQRLKFGDFAENVAVRVDDPSNAGVERYVGLEHLDPDSLEIARWGSPDDVEATKLRFWAGDIVFGRRRAYQRKVAVAEFEGICSAHALVIRAKRDVVLPEFLPFFMQSETFFQRALSISVGSLSPTINWKTLREQEFDLPPITEQREIAALLWTTEGARRSWKKVNEKLSAARANYFDHLVAEARSAPVHLGELLTSVEYGTSKRCSEEREDGDSPVLRIPNVVSGRLDLADLKWARFTPDEFDKYRVEPGDVLVVRTNGNPRYVGRGVAVDDVELPGTVFASYLIRLRTRRDVLDPRFLGAMLDAPGFRMSLRPSIRSSAGNFNLNSANIKRQPIRIPALDAQIAIVERLAYFDRQQLSVNGHAAALAAVKDALIGDLLTLR